MFEHRDFPDAGLQVPAGTLLDGESPEHGVIREVEEETGRRGFRIRRKVGSYDYEYQDEERHEMQERQVFELEAPPDPPRPGARD